MRKRKRPYKLLGKKMNGKEVVIQAQTSVEFASSFITRERKRYEKLGFLYLYTIPVE